MKNLLIIITSEQFGYYTDAIYYTKYLSKIYNITYICWDHGMKKIDSPHANIVYVNRTGGPLRLVRFIKAILKNSTSEKTILFIKHIKLISSITRILLRKNPIIFDIRSSSVSSSPVKRFFGNCILKSELKLFKNITIINESLAQKLHLKNNYKILPIGAEKLSNTKKTFDEFSLLYIGTLYNRHIENVISGFSKFYDKYKEICPLRLSIIGDGKSNEIDLLKAEVKRYKLEKVVKILGWVSHDKLGPYLDTHNIGISWIPITSYYDIQPATKTFEYLFAGLPVLATKTSENKCIINKINGVTTGDSPEEFYHCLVGMYQERTNYDSDKIRATVQSHSWEKITTTLSQYIESCVT